MKFSKVIGKIDPSLVSKAEEALSKCFLDLAARYDNIHVGSGLGGDPFIFSLMFPVEHVCTMNLPTAGTDGKRYYWNPKFVIKQSRIGLRIICYHEAFHAVYLHPIRRGSRLPKLWNIAVDYIVNATAMDDLKTRKQDPHTSFTKHLGRYMSLNVFVEMLKNPFVKIPGFEDITPAMKDPDGKQNELPAPNEDRELTPEEMKELERREKRISFFYADPNLETDMRRPEKIYDMLYDLLPKCPKCGSVGMYKMPKSKNKDKKDKNNDQYNGQKSKDKKKTKGKGQEKDQDSSHSHGDGDPCQDPNCQEHDNQDGQSCGSGQGDCDHGCDECGDGVDIFGLGGTIDEHMDTEESQEKLAKRISDAMETAKRMAGHIPAEMESELGKLTAPKITWQDVIRCRMLKARAGNGRNDWTRFRTRPMFTGMLVPKKKNYIANFGCLLDTSGSMSKEDMAYGLSQLQALDERSEGTIVPCDCKIYWDKATKLRKVNAEELQKVKVVGRGGTMFSGFFNDYEKNIGKCDFLLIVTDGYLLDTDIADMVNPGIDTYWIITSNNDDFKPPFGKVFNLKD